eukprot:scaffold183449_cov18-Prasinocladus_malaysianus.AAC.1
MWQFVAGKRQLDTPSECPASAQRSLAYLGKTPQTRNGSRMWRPIMRGLVVAGDASAIGFGARPLSLVADLLGDLMSVMTVPSESDMAALGLASL